jgi:hypothetical protein
VASRQPQSHGRRGVIDLYSDAWASFLESYLLMGLYFSQMGESRWEKRALLNEIVKFAESRLAMNALRYPESISVYNFGNALLRYERVGWIQIKKSEEGSFIDRVVEGETIQESVRKISDWLDLMDENPGGFFQS